MRARSSAAACTVLAVLMFLGPSAFGAAMTGPTGTVSGWSLSSSGSNSISGGTLVVSALASSYTVTVQADKSKMSEYASGAYVSGGQTLGASLRVQATKTSSTGLFCNGTGATVNVGTSAVTVASGPGGLACSDTYSVTLLQTTALTDQALSSGHSYHIILTYTLSGGL